MLLSSAPKMLKQELCRAGREGRHIVQSKQRGLVVSWDLSPLPVDRILSSGESVTVVTGEDRGRESIHVVFPGSAEPFALALVIVAPA